MFLLAYFTLSTPSVCVLTVFRLISSLMCNNLHSPNAQMSCNNRLWYHHKRHSNYIFKIVLSKILRFLTYRFLISTLMDTNTHKHTLSHAHTAWSSKASSRGMILDVAKRRAEKTRYTYCTGLRLKFYVSSPPLTPDLILMP